MVIVRDIEGGVMNVLHDAPTARVVVSGSRIQAYVNPDAPVGGQTEIRGVPMPYIRVKLEWLGGTEAPEIVDQDPGARNQVLRVDLHGVSDPHEWVFVFDFFGMTPPQSVVRIHSTPGDLLQQVTFSGFEPTAPLSRVGFITRNSVGTPGQPIFPAPGDICWLTVPV